MAVDISWVSLALSLILLAAPVAVVIALGLGRLREMLIAVVRMTVQLLLVGLLLVYLFDLNLPIVNVAWFFVMVAVASVTVVRGSGLRVRTLLVPSFVSILISGSAVLLFFTGILLGRETILDARYFIALGGMLVGNSLRGNIVAIGSFYEGVKRDENRYRYRLSVGARRIEALLPNLRASMRAAFAPTIATMTTTGIVALPGMMTGQILGGSSPLVAVKYQIAIMIAILSSVALSTSLCLLLSIPAAFDAWGMLRPSVFRMRSE